MTGTRPHRRRSAAFCSYHSQVNVGGTDVAYVVQPWTAGTGCDEPDAPDIPPNPTPQQLAVGVGPAAREPAQPGGDRRDRESRPERVGWRSTARRSNDNDGCFAGSASGLDSVTLGNSSQNPYYLQREFNNAGALEFDPNTYFGCAPDVILSPEFVVPSAVDAGRRDPVRRLGHRLDADRPEGQLPVELRRRHHRHRPERRAQLRQGR